MCKFNEINSYCKCETYLYIRKINNMKEYNLFANGQMLKTQMQVCASQKYFNKKNSRERSKFEKTNHICHFLYNRYQVCISWRKISIDK
jgi:hypothetical protein